MAKTIVGLFDDFAHAQQVVRDLVDHGFRREDISLIANDAAREHSTTLGLSDNTAAVADDTASDTMKGAGIGAGIGGVAGLLVGLGALAIPGVGPIIAAGPIASALAGAGIGAVAGGLIGALTNLGVPEEEAHVYAEGVRRGGTLVAVKSSDEDADKAADIMSRHNPVDIDRRSTMYRENDWKGFSHEAEPYRHEDIHAERERVGNVERVPVVEEELTVGKREVQRGGARVHTWVEERPVQEQVRLRDETVHVERHDVDRPLTDADAAGAFRERTIEMTETDEEAVAAKRARVTEEVVISKDVDERVETVSDTVRRTNVEVENTGGAFGGDEDYRTHFNSTYANRGYTYEQFAPAYGFGSELRRSGRYTGDWNAHEADFRRDWEGRYGAQGKWEDFKDAVRHGWDRMTR